MTIHLKYGGSIAARTMGCPAWHRLSAEVPKGVGGSNPAADEGTLLHNCMEEVYSVEDADPLNFIGVREYNGITLTRDMVDEKLTPAIEAVEKIFEQHDIADWQCEPFVQIDEDIGGSIDLLAISADKKTVVVLDYKFGYHSVSVENNAQLLFYALAAATDKKTRDWFDSAEKIVLAVVQPNEDGDTLQTFDVTMDDVDNFETKYLAAVEASEDPQSVATAGAWCKYCPAHATCPVKTGAALKATRVNTITADRLAEYLPLAEEVLAWAAEVQKMAHEQLELGLAIKGYKLVAKRAMRVWNDTDAVEDKIRKAKKIKLEEGFDLKLKSPAQLEKVCKRKGIDFDSYTDYISSVSSGTTLAKESDPRPAAIPIQGLKQLNELNA
jgi:RecB family exonuclease